MVPIIIISSLAGLFLAIFRKLCHLMHNPLMKEVLLLMLTLEVMGRKKGTEDQTVKGAARTSRIRWLLDLCTAVKGTLSDLKFYFHLLLIHLRFLWQLIWGGS